MKKRKRQPASAKKLKVSAKFSEAKNTVIKIKGSVGRIGGRMEETEA